MNIINGILHFGKDPVPIPVKDIYNLMKSLRQFPADDIDIWSSTNIFFGCHAKWTAQDPYGTQLPYNDYKKNLAITADVMIDNREELFESLKVDGMYKESISDSQLILLAYDKYGEEVPKHLMGYFTFMIWDGNKQKLFGASDDTGSNPLYFYKGQGRFAFSTKIESLFTLPYISKQPNREWVFETHATPQTKDRVDPSLTVYKMIYKVPASHTITVVKGDVIIKKYNPIEVNKGLKNNSNKEYEVIC